MMCSSTIVSAEQGLVREVGSIWLLGNNGGKGKQEIVRPVGLMFKDMQERLVFARIDHLVSRVGVGDAWKPWELRR